MLIESAYDSKRPEKEEVMLNVLAISISILIHVGVVLAIILLISLSQIWLQVREDFRKN
jgi:uncharacterized BrkB/YihY/UPF0761 family membrane protein